MKLFSDFLKTYIPYDGKSHQWPQIFAVIAATLGCFGTGTLTTWTSPSISILTSNSSHIGSITLEEASYFTVIPPIAAVIASPILAILVDGIGRQKCIMFISVFYFLSWVLIAAANSIHLLYLSRFLAGIGDAALFTTVPIYIGEVADPKVRGFWGNFMAWFWYLGQFLINVIGAYCDIRTTAFIFISIPLAQFLLFTFMPESPYFLLMKNREEEARISLQRLNWKENVDEELKSLTKDVHRQISESGTFLDIFTNVINRKAFMISVGIRASQQFSGLPAFSMYTQYMFEQAGSNLSASTSSIIFCGVLLVCVTGFVFTVHRFGRKPLLTISCFACGIVLSFEAVYFFIHEKTNLDTSGVRWLPLAGMLLYIPSCTVGVGLLPAVMIGELFSASIKGKAVSILNIFFSVFVLTVSKLFQTLSVNFGMYVPFCLFSVCCFSGTVFSYCFIPETKGRTLEQIQQQIRGCKGNKSDKAINQVMTDKF